MKRIMDNEVGSMTSRDMREGEVQGREYTFTTMEVMEDMIINQKMAEWTRYDGNLYGTTLEELHDKLGKGHAYVICDNHGFKQFKESYDNVVSIFLYADSTDCIDNMMGRGDAMSKVEGRIKTYNDEMANKGQYDYVVKNIRGFAKLTENIVEEIIYAEISKFAQEVTK
jgi:guanylate kinase